MSVWDGDDRFSLLLLEEGEYYFRDYACHLLRGAARCDPALPVQRTLAPTAAAHWAVQPRRPRPGCSAQEA